MKHISSGVAAFLFAVLILAGCSSDSPTTPTDTDPTAVSFKANQKWTFHYYDRDAANARVSSSKKVKVWTVLKVDQTVGGRSGVAVVEEAAFDSTGVTKQGLADTFYFESKTADGAFSQYNLLRNVLKRIDGAALFLDSVPQRWILVGNTKKTDAGTWDAIDGGGPIERTVTISGFPVTITFAMNATHKGKQAVTVPKAAYDKSFHTDQRVRITNSLYNTSDTLTLGYDISPKDGVLRQVLNSGAVFNGGMQITGFEMELVSVTP